jgi:predicted nuclease of predicted toxin-antitoxin system
VIALLLDEGLPRRAASDLRALGWDVVHVAEIGLAGADDETIMAAADRDGRVVATLDNDMAHLLYLSGARRPSVVLFRMDRLDRAATVAQLESVVPAVEDDLREGAIVSVDLSGARVRRLPI